MKKTLRKILPVLALVLVVAVASVGGTLAWLTATTGTVTNTFTVGDISITLDETTGTSYKVIPGKEITKDPKVTVLKGSEACWLFVKVEKDKWNDKLSFEIADGWTELTTGSGIYWREVGDLTAADAKDVVYPVLKDNKINVANTVQKNEITAGNEPKLSFTAYAIQKEGSTTAADAWTKLNPTTGA